LWLSGRTELLFETREDLIHRKHPSCTAQFPRFRLGVAAAAGTVPENLSRCSAFLSTVDCSGHPGSGHPAALLAVFELGLPRFPLQDESEIVQVPEEGQLRTLLLVPVLGSPSYLALASVALCSLTESVFYCRASTADFPPAAFRAPP